MYIEPNSIVKLCANVPLDDSYDHAVNWSSKEQQQQYFESKVIKVFPKVYYQRPYLGQIKVEASADEIFNCNYLMFQNTSYGNKWFYAFVNKVEYSNNNTAVLLYNIDLLTTWHFDYQLLESLVEREHVQNDAKYSNMVAENLDLGRGYKNDLEYDLNLSEMNVCLVHSRIPLNDTGDYSVPTPTVRRNIYTPVGYSRTSINNVDEINSMVERFVKTGQEDALINIYEYPAKLGLSGESTITHNGQPLSNIDGYVPRNNKLFNYPYCFTTVTNNAGNTAEFKHELSSNPNHVMSLKMEGTFAPIPATIMYPQNYRGIEKDYDSGLIINNFPQCPWVGDTYKAWWAQNKASVAFQGEAIEARGQHRIGASLFGGLTNTGNISVSREANYARAIYAPERLQGPFIQNAINTIGQATIATASLNMEKLLHAKQVMARKEDLQNTPPQVHGQLNTDGLNVAIGKVGYKIYNTHIYSDTARRIDSYFDRYGYEVDMFKIPSRQNRKHFTYLKTNGCEVTGDMPAEDFKSICSIYDHGVTWWVNPNEVGHYELASDNLGGR